MVGSSDPQTKKGANSGSDSLIDHSSGNIKGNQESADPLLLEEPESPLLFESELGDCVLVSAAASFL